MRGLVPAAALVAALALTACPGRSPSVGGDGRVDAGSVTDGGSERE